MNFNKTLVLLLMLILLLYSPAQVLAATLVLSPSTGNFNKGCTAQIAINLDTQGAKTDGTDALLIYDPTRFNITPQSISNGTIYPDYPGNTVQNGRISISGLSSVSQGFTGQGTLATITLQVVDNAPAGATTITFDFDPNDKAKTTDSNVVERGTVADVLNGVTDGHYTIGTGSCTTGTASSPNPSSLIFQGAGGISTPSATPLTSLNPGGKSPGITGPTLILTLAGTILTILGIVGLAIL